MEPLLRVRGLRKHFPIREGVLLAREVDRVHAVDDVSLDVAAGETVGLVGESGCGKSTLGRCMIRLYELTAGRVSFDGTDISTLSQRQLRPLRSDMQMVFQDPYGSLNPRKRAGEIVAAPIALHRGGRRSEIRAQVRELFELVGLSVRHLDRYPNEFSGGQRQRIGIARAIAVKPRLIVADEPVSALDVSIQAQVINLLAELQEQLGLTYVFIAHDLAVVRHVSDRIAVMYLGKVVEVAPAEELLSHPVHAYTEALVSAVPLPDPDEAARRRRVVVAGDVASPIRPPSGCRFHARCPRATEICAAQEPRLEAVGAGHLAACHHPANLPSRHQRRQPDAPRNPVPEADADDR